jgi:hypothetical protein
MNIKTLEQYIEKKNKLRIIFGEYPLNLRTPASRQAIANMIDADMSPENLTCDGELSPSVVTRKLRQLTRAAEELLSIDPTVSFYEMGV